MMALGLLSLGGRPVASKADWSDTADIAQEELCVGFYASVSWVFTGRLVARLRCG